MASNLALVLLFVSQVVAQATTPTTPASMPESSPESWSFSLSVSGYLVPHDRSYASPVFTADHKQLHFAARYNYEDKETGSLWAGYNLETGEKVKLSVTPMLGGVFGNTSGIAPGYLASLAWKRVELSTEGEYVFDTKETSGSFFYSWMELSYSPAEWLRGGLVAQRTKAYHTDLDIQRGFLVGVSRSRLDLTTYVFNLGWTDPTVVLSLGVHF